MDFFYPSNEVETPATYLAEIEAEEPTVLAEVAAEVEQKAPKSAKDAVQAVKNAKKAKSISSSSSDGSESDGSGSGSSSSGSSGSGSSSDSNKDSSGSSDSEADTSSTESEGEAVPAKPAAAKPAAAPKAGGSITKSIDGLMVTHPTACGCPQASKCCKKPGDPLKKAIGILEADEENKKDEWQPETSTAVGKQEPVTICQAELDADLEGATDEQLNDELAAIESELANDEL